MEQSITKDVLRSQLHAGQVPAIEFLYSRYGSMLFAYILQFVPERRQAENFLIAIFSSLACRLEDACHSNLSVYCWLQVEARKIILGSGTMAQAGAAPTDCPTCYSGLLQDAPPELQWVFRELFVNGRQKEELATQMGKEPADIDILLRDSLQFMRKRL